MIRVRTAKRRECRVDHTVVSSVAVGPALVIGLEVCDVAEAVCIAGPPNCMGALRALGLGSTTGTAPRPTPDGRWNIPADDPAYRPALDKNHDGIACVSRKPG
jgi:hypothetical protein